MPTKSILDRWELTVADLTEIVDSNPSLRGMMLGYVAEAVLRKKHFSDKHFVGVVKDDDHDRSSKGDLRFTYNGKDIRVECKSLQTNSIRKTSEGFVGTFQCDASDSRMVKFSDGSEVVTTCLKVGEFDILAVNLYGFEQKWKFAFALNSDLPRSKYGKYSEVQKRELLSSSMKISLPLQAPYVDNPIVLLDRITKKKRP